MNVDADDMWFISVFLFSPILFISAAGYAEEGKVRWKEDRCV